MKIANSGFVFNIRVVDMEALDPTQLESLDLDMPLESYEFFSRLPYSRSRDSLL